MNGQQLIPDWLKGFLEATGRTFQFWSDFVFDARAGKAPNLFSRVIVPTADIFGTTRLSHSEKFSRYEQVTGAGVVEVLGGLVPPTEVWYVPFCDFFHTSVATVRLNLQIRAFYGGVARQVTKDSNQSSTQNQVQVMTEQIYVPSGGRLRVESSAAVNLNIRYYYWPLPIGEYVWSP